jgi:hypothetical protein
MLTSLNFLCELLLQELVLLENCRVSRASLLMWYETITMELLTTMLAGFLWYRDHRHWERIHDGQIPWYRAGERCGVVELKAVLS